jgi:hypothetical protein
MEYVGYGLVVLIGLAMYFFRPKQVYKFLADAVTNNLVKNEAEIVKGLYNGLPIDVKKVVTSKQIAMIVASVIDLVQNIIEETKE